MPQHVSVLFNALFDELKSMKQQQWTLTNYAVLIPAAAYTIKLPDINHYRDSNDRINHLAVASAQHGAISPPA